MTDDPVSRRELLVIAGATVALPLVRTASAAERAPEPMVGVGSSATQASPEVVALRLLSPLVAGSKLGAWTIERVIPVTDGAVSVVLTDVTRISFQLDVCARDDSLDSRRGPARSEKFEIFLANRGDGSVDTHEDHGLAAMALAEVIRANEPHVSASSFRTLAARIAAEHARVHVD